MTGADKKYWTERIAGHKKIDQYRRWAYFAELVEEAEGKYPILSDNRSYALSMILTEEKRDYANRHGMENLNATRPAFLYGWRMKEVTA